MEGIIATITMFAGNFAPKNWAFCNGQMQSIASNTALFALLGTTYGGNGRTNFGLPNLQGRVAIGAGEGPGLSNYNLGQTGGTASVTMTEAQMPAHTHTAGAVSILVSNSAATSNQPDNNILATPIAKTYATAGTTPTVHNSGFSAEIHAQGGSNPFRVTQPSLGMNYIICLHGYFPSRS
jgi:microcystin-dependent protein